MATTHSSVSYRTREEALTSEFRWSFVSLRCLKDFAVERDVVLYSFSSVHAFQKFRHFLHPISQDPPLSALMTDNPPKHHDSCQSNHKRLLFDCLSLLLYDHSLFLPQCHLNEAVTSRLCISIQIRSSAFTCFDKFPRGHLEGVGEGEPLDLLAPLQHCHQWADH